MSEPFYNNRSRGPRSCSALATAMPDETGTDNADRQGGELGRSWGAAFSDACWFRYSVTMSSKLLSGTIPSEGARVEMKPLGPAIGNFLQIRIRCKRNIDGGLVEHDAIASTISIMLTVSAGWLSTRLPRSLTGSALCSRDQVAHHGLHRDHSHPGVRPQRTYRRPAGSAVANHGGEPVGHRWRSADRDAPARSAAAAHERRSRRAAWHRFATGAAAPDIPELDRCVRRLAPDRVDDDTQRPRRRPTGPTRRSPS